MDQFGTVLAEDDTLRLYVQTEGVLHLMLGDKGRTKQAPNKVVQWGFDTHPRVRERQTEISFASLACVPFV